jgi:hypothetical protein
MARSWFDAFFGRLLNNGTELELIGGVNFVGFTITADTVNGYYTIVNPGPVIADNSVALAKLVNASAQYDFIMRKTAGAGSWERGTRADLVSAIDSQTVATFFGAPRIQLGGASTTRGLLNASIGGFGTNGGLIIAARTNGGVECDVVRWDSTDKLFLGDADDAAQVIASVETGGWFAVRVNNVEQVRIDATGIVLGGRLISGLTTLNGSRYISPTQGADLGDANVTINLSGGANYYMPASTTTTARTVTIGNTGVGAAPNDKGVVSVTVMTQGHDVVFNNNSAAAIYTLTASSSARVLDFQYDHVTTNYVFRGWKPVQ